jgi:hypothetical protein
VVHLFSFTDFDVQAIDFVTVARFIGEHIPQVLFRYV